MIFTAIILLFMLGVSSIYALIQTGKNYALLVIIIPLLLVSTIFAGYSIYALQGSPKPGVPAGEVEIVWVEIQKPVIVFTVRTEGDTIPVYHIIPYNDENNQMMQDMKKRSKEGKEVRGTFMEIDPLENGGEPTDEKTYEFDDINRLPYIRKGSNDNPYGQIPRGVDSGIARAVERNTNSR